MSPLTFDAQHTDAVSTYVLPMPRPYIPIPNWLTALEWFALVVVPVWFLCSALVRAIRQIEPPPRAKFTIGADDFTMQLCDPKSGEKTSFSCRRDLIVEFRKNRHEPGLWIRAKGVLMETFLQDINDATIEALSQSVRDTLGLAPDANA